MVEFGAKLSFFFFCSVYLYEKLNYVNGCVVRMLLEAKPIKVLSEPIFVLNLIDIAIQICSAIGEKQPVTTSAKADSSFSFTG
jgi:hypothetical protein